MVSNCPSRMQRKRGGNSHNLRFYWYVYLGVSVSACHPSCHPRCPSIPLFPKVRGAPQRRSPIHIPSHLKQHEQGRLLCRLLLLRDLFHTISISTHLKHIFTSRVPSQQDALSASEGWKKINIIISRTLKKNLVRPAGSVCHLRCDSICLIGTGCWHDWGHKETHCGLILNPSQIHSSCLPTETFRCKY